MRVVCIDDTWALADGCPKLVKGNIYTVIDTMEVSQFRTSSGKLTENGTYYILMEMGKIPAYHYSLFVPINENQQDETELIKERNELQIIQ